MILLMKLSVLEIIYLLQSQKLCTLPPSLFRAAISLSLSSQLGVSKSKPYFRFIVSPPMKYCLVLVHIPDTGQDLNLYHVSKGCINHHSHPSVLSHKNAFIQQKIPSKAFQSYINKMASLTQECGTSFWPSV